MKSIKPGRGPSGLGVFMGIIVSLFGVFWTIMVISIGAYFMVPFGVLFVAAAIGTAVFNYKNATGTHRYSEFDIVDEDEEPDPSSKRSVNKSQNIKTKKFCPHCGEKAEENHKFCGNCGSRLE
jgi:uncharacterized membrane protein